MGTTHMLENDNSNVQPKFSSLQIFSKSNFKIMELHQPLNLQTFESLPYPEEVVGSNFS